MSTTKIENFFTGKTLQIPGYQREYAWKERNVNDLFGDVEEALEVGGGHYLGTFILSQKEPGAPVQVVDGQQRLTTLTMVLDALIDAVDDISIKQHYHSIFIHNPMTGPKFMVLGSNEVFFRDLLAEKLPEPQSDGQVRLLRAYEWIRLRVKALLTQGGQDLIKKWLLCISQMDVLEFIERDEGKAIRMFQSVNDRGVRLAKMDIVKSLLVYYSNRYLGGTLDDSISQQFGKAFRSFSRIKELARADGYKVRLVDRDSFREDDVLRYHYLAFDGVSLGASIGGDYTATTETVLETFLKPALQSLRSDAVKLKAFITAYVADLAAFFAGLEQLLDATRSDCTTYKLFVVQDLSATLYPLLIRLQLMGWLPMVGKTSDSRTLLEILEMVDLRVFKLKGTNPQADVFRITRALPKLALDHVILELQDFCRRFMPDALMNSRLVDEDLYRNPGISRMLLEEEEIARPVVNLPPLDVPQMVALNRIGLTVEHILPQEPGTSFNTAAYGFTDADEYQQHIHRIGNLVLLEAPLNSACNNQTVENKMTAPNLYISSTLSSVKELSAQFAGNTQRFQRQSLDARSKLLAGVMATHWPIVLPVPVPVSVPTVAQESESLK